MNIDITKAYFMLSFRSNKNKPSDFVLVPSQEYAGLYELKADGSIWRRKELYDFGWGNECGFVRFPDLDFEDLWMLLLKSSIKDNQYGAAYVIQEKFSDSLLEELIKRLNDPDQLIDSALKKAAVILQLDTIRNRSSILGKTSQQIQEDYNKWKCVTERLFPAGN